MSTEIHSTVWKAKELLAEIKHMLSRTIIYIFLTEGREANSVCHFRKSVDFGRKNLLCHIFLKVPITPIHIPEEEKIIITTAHAFFINTKKCYTTLVLLIIIF